MRKNPLTVYELIKELEEFPSDWLVYISAEGVDKVTEVHATSATVGGPEDAVMLQ